jgi:hypothetical protein
MWVGGPESRNKSGQFVQQLEFQVINRFKSCAFALFIFFAAVSAHATPPGNGNSRPEAQGGSATAGAIGLGVGVGVGIGGNGGKANASANQQLKSTIKNKTIVNVSTPVAPAQDTTGFRALADALQKPQLNEAPTAEPVYVGGYERDDRPVSSAYAAPLVASPETCLGSSSGGVQTNGLGVTFASTYDSADCNRRMDARMWQVLGKADIAIARMCQSKENREAAGSVCPKSPTTAAAPQDAVARTTVAASATNDLNLLP